MPTVRSRSSTPGWNVNARLLKGKANFWYNVCRQAGCPTSGVLFQIKRSAKSRYKYEVRHLRWREQFIRREKMAAALVSGNSRSFWQQVHRVNKPKLSTPVMSVDGISGADNISWLFSTKLSADDLTRFLVSVKCFKSDGSAVLSDHFIQALPAIRGFIAMLFTAILRHR